MRIHLIAIGGSAMHNMALAMHYKGFNVSGSDDEINEPSRTRLKDAGLLPDEIGWFPNKITKDIDAVILGMHAREDNPELVKARELSLKIYSYPEYIYEQTKDKVRIVVGGSHGKTTITSMILHVLKYAGIDADFMVGAQLAGFDTMVKLTKEAKYAVIEGDEYLASPIDRRPKFHLYHPNIAIISGIAWDHINVFPTFDVYVDQFRKFIDLIEPSGSLVYCNEDRELKKLAEEISRKDLKKYPYSIPKHRIENGITYIEYNGKERAMQIFGDHNLMNMNGARLVCNTIGIDDSSFYEAMSSFKGASKRLELVKAEKDFAMYKDFAHSPSKLKATIDATKKQFPDRKLVACMELHTFSSLTEEFLKEYHGAMDGADEAIVYFNPHTIAHKKLKPITEDQVKQAFSRPDIRVLTESQKVKDFLLSENRNHTTVLMMSSGNFDGIDFAVLANELPIN